MNSAKLITTIACLLILFATGFWLKRSGKPYTMVGGAIHKLAGVGIGAILILAVIGKTQAAPLSGVEIILIAVTVLLYIGLAATGGILMSEKTVPGLTFSHKILPYLTLISTGILMNRLF